MKIINRGFLVISKKSVDLNGVCMMKIRLHLEETTINCLYGNRYLMVKTILPSLISTRQQLKQSDGVLNKEDYLPPEEALPINASGFGTPSICSILTV